MAIRPLTCPFSRRSALACMSWFLWFCLAALLVLPVVAAFIEDRPPRNEITQEQPGPDDQDRDGEPDGMLAAA